MCAFYTLRGKWKLSQNGCEQYEKDRHINGEIDGVCQCRTHHYQHVLFPYSIMIMYFHNYYCYQWRKSDDFATRSFFVAAVHSIPFSLVDRKCHYINVSMKDHALPICHHTGRLMSTNLFVRALLMLFWENRFAVVIRYHWRSSSERVNVIRPQFGQVCPIMGWRWKLETDTDTDKHFDYGTLLKLQSYNWVVNQFMCAKHKWQRNRFQRDSSPVYWHSSWSKQKVREIERTNDLRLILIVFSVSPNDGRKMGSEYLKSSMIWNYRIFMCE